MLVHNGIRWGQTDLQNGVPRKQKVSDRLVQHRRNKNPPQSTGSPASSDKKTKRVSFAVTKNHTDVLVTPSPRKADSESSTAYESPTASNWSLTSHGGAITSPAGAEVPACASTTGKILFVSPATSVASVVFDDTRAAETRVAVSADITVDDSDSDSDVTENSTESNDAALLQRGGPGDILRDTPPQQVHGEIREAPPSRRRAARERQLASLVPWSAYPQGKYYSQKGLVQAVAAGEVPTALKDVRLRSATRESPRQSHALPIEAGTSTTARSSGVALAGKRRRGF